MCIHARDIEIGHIAENRNYSFGFRGLKAVSAHAGVDLYMDIAGKPLVFSHAVQCDRGVIGTNGGSSTGV